LKAFPVWGTGYGTFEYVEPLYLHTSQDVGSLYGYAHNDYLQAMIEGGLIRLLLSMLVIVSVCRLGYRAISRHRGEPAGALALGAMFGFIAMVIHSFVESGLQVPSIAVLATVLCAYLCGMAGSAGPQSDTGKENPKAGAWNLRLGGAAPVAGSAAAVLLGLVLIGSGWTRDRVARLQIAAAGAATGKRPSLEYQIDCLDRATRLAAEDADLQVQLAQAHLDLFERQKSRLPSIDQEGQKQTVR
jgi:hypothetical protein